MLKVPAEVTTRTLPLRTVSDVTGACVKVTVTSQPLPATTDAPAVQLVVGAMTKYGAPLVSVMLVMVNAPAPAGLLICAVSVGSAGGTRPKASGDWANVATAPTPVNTTFCVTAGSV